MVKINNLSQFKKAISVGVKLHTLHLKLGDLGVRKISVVQTNQFALETLTSKGVQDSWHAYGKADVYKFDGTNAVLVMSNNQVLLIYRFVD